jgi:hypothetical protein
MLYKQNVATASVLTATKQNVTIHAGAMTVLLYNLFIFSLLNDSVKVGLMTEIGGH